MSSDVASTEWSDHLPVVALAGGTGRLGSTVARTFLSSTFKAKFSRIIILTRDPSSPTSRDLEALGAELRRFWDDAANDTALKGVDIVISFLGSYVPDGAKEALLQAITANDVKVYFPGEYCTAHWESEEWTRKRAHISRAHEVLGPQSKTKIVAVFVGLFLEGTILEENFVGPLLGFDIKRRSLEAVGTASSPITFTAKDDIGRALAQLCVTSMSRSSARPPSPDPDLPEFVRISGSSATFAGIKQYIQDASALDIEVKILDMNDYKKAVREEFKGGALKHPAKHIRILMGERKLDFSEGNSNNLVNPDQTLWRWKTVEDLIREAYKGRK